MTFRLGRRALLSLAVATSVMAAVPATAQDTVELNFSAVFSANDIRAEMMNKFAEALTDEFTFNGYYGATLFAQGTELVAIQRGNLEMGNIAPQDVSNQLPAFSILTSAYLFRDADHLRTFFNSEPGEEMKAMAEDELGSSWARHWARTRLRWPMPRSTPALRRARSTGRTTRCPTCRT